MTKTAEKTYPLGPHIPMQPIWGSYRPPEVRGLGYAKQKGNGLCLKSGDIWMMEAPGDI